MKGGKRKGAGRPKGAQNKITLERKAVAEAFNQRVMTKADALFNAQLRLAIGSMKVFRIDEIKEGKKTRHVHTHVTDVDEIKALLDEHDGGSGEVDGSYYYFADVLPDNKAIDSMLNRALGKPVETLEHTGKDGGPIETCVILPKPNV
jgi:hypothetical protein